MSETTVEDQAPDVQTPAETASEDLPPVPEAPAAEPDETAVIAVVEGRVPEVGDFVAYGATRFGTEHGEFDVDPETGKITGPA